MRVKGGYMRWDMSGAHRRATWGMSEAAPLVVVVVVVAGWSQNHSRNSRHCVMCRRSTFVGQAVNEQVCRVVDGWVDGIE